MPIQTTYLTSPAVAVEGMVADASRDTYTISRAAGVTIAAGRLCVRQADGICKLPTAAGDITTVGLVLGVSVYDAMRAPGTYVQYDMVQILRRGPIYVVTEDAVVEGSDVYVRHTANGGNTIIGGFRGTTDVGAALLANAKFRSTASAGGLAVIELNTP